MKTNLLIGSAKKIARFVVPYLIAGLIANILYPGFFKVGGPSDLLQWVSVFLLFTGVINWVWSAKLILAKVPQQELITAGPFAIVKHPLYTGVAFLIFPWIGILLNSWLGIVLGIVLYIGSRLYSQEEEKTLALQFGREWDDYCKKVLLPWL